MTGSFSKDEKLNADWACFTEIAASIIRSCLASNLSENYLHILKLVTAAWKSWVQGDPVRRASTAAAKANLTYDLFKKIRAEIKSSVAEGHSKESGWVTEAVKANRYYWPMTRKMMAKMGKEVVESIDKNSEELLNKIHDPKEGGSWQCRGLVIGSIQAGKTANYSALISKAADAGYRLINVLAGIHNDLRQQTQKRLDRDFVGFSLDEKGKKERVGVGDLPEYDEDRIPQCATDVNQDFDGAHAAIEERPWLFVVKKEKTRLDNLLKWMKNQQLKNVPSLVIDDEADQASINTENGIEEASRINSQIRKILSQAPRCTYLAYTASPFANFFVDASINDKELGQDLFPKDFIHQIPTPKNYFGPKEYFDPESQEESVLFMPFPLAQAQSWISKDEVGALPDAARTCLLQFIVSAAIKAWREHQQEGAKKPYESSMLVHVSHLTEVHRKLAKNISEELAKIRKMVDYGTPGCELDRVLEGLFERQKKTTELIRKARHEVDRKKDWSLPDTWDELFKWIKKTVMAMSVQIVNGETNPDRQGCLQPIEEPEYVDYVRPIVWVGGNKLSRGLTIPSLCMSLFLRGTGAADTLLQMGRWFGYRDGYSDLCRISTTQALADNFMKITCSLDDLSDQISEMNSYGKTPAAFNFILQQHPAFSLTSPAKMRTAEDAPVCYAGCNVEMRRFKLSDQAPQLNYEAAERFLRQVDESGLLVYDSRHLAESIEPQPSWLEERSRASGLLWRNVPAKAVTDFLSSYVTDNGTGSCNREIHKILDYIEKENNENRLISWNVWIRRGSKLEDYLPLLDDIAPIDRDKSADSDNVDGDFFRLSVMQTGGDQFMGVRKNLMEAAKKSFEELNKKGNGKTLFYQVRKLAASKEAAGEHADEGYFRLYSIKSDKLRSSSRIQSSSGASYPLISYALWMPGNLVIRGKSNVTVHAKEDGPLQLGSHGEKNE